MDAIILAVIIFLSGSPKVSFGGTSMGGAGADGGRGRRKAVPRSSHAAWAPGTASTAPWRTSPRPTPTAYADQTEADHAAFVAAGEGLAAPGPGRSAGTNQRKGAEG